MVDLLDLQKSFILAHLGEGDTAVDFTMGNGGDTAFLSETVGESGRVYAFDIQKEALASTEAHLRALGRPENYTLIHASHHRVREFVEGPIKAGNLLVIHRLYRAPSPSPRLPRQQACELYRGYNLGSSALH